MGLRRDQEKLLNEAAHVTALRVNSEENSGVGLLLCRDFVRKNGENYGLSKENIGLVFSFSLLKLK